MALVFVLGCSAFMVSPLAAVPVLLLGFGWFRRAGRHRSRLLVVSAGARFALPVEGRFDLALSPASRSGPGWQLLVLGENPATEMLLVRDQLDATARRRLEIAIRERR